MNIAGREIGSERPPFVVAELGLNHCGKLVIALEMVRAAKRAGADAVKLQTHCADEFCDTPAYAPNGGGESIQDFVKRCSLSENDERRVFDYARELRIICFSTPFSPLAVERLERLGVPAYKAGSGQLRDLDLLRMMAFTRKPMIISTGMASDSEIADAWRATYTPPIPRNQAWLHCTSEYPTPMNHVRLNAMGELPGDIIGLSDHTGTIWPSLGAVALGASILEVHFKTPECPPGPDLCVSIDEAQLAQLVEGANAIWQCGGGEKTVLPGEAATLKWFQASRRK